MTQKQTNSYNKVGILSLKTRATRRLVWPTQALEAVTVTRYSLVSDVELCVDCRARRCVNEIAR